MKTILYATDLNKKSAKALQYVYQLSKSLDADLHLVHVYDLLPLVTTSVRARTSLEDNYSEEQKRILQNYCKKHLGEGFDLSEINYHVKRNDDTRDGILRTAEELDPDLVVVGSKKSYTLRGIFRSSTADMLMKHLACPLLVLPLDSAFKELSTLLYATDFDESDIKAIHSLTTLASPFKAGIRVFHVEKTKDEQIDEKVEWLKNEITKRISYSEIEYTSQRSEDIENGILEQLNTHKPEILVMMERQRNSFWTKLMHKDMVRAIEDQVEIPILIYSKKQLQAKGSEQIDDAGMMKLA
jgi:nucleotide-binding universal stress UspA family protein